MSVAHGLWAMACAAVGVGCAPEPAVTALPAPVALEIAADGSIALPSGLVVRLHETRLEPKGAQMNLVNTVRLRYVSEQLGDTEGFGFERVEGDFTHLCASFGLATRARSAPNADQIIISMASEETAFGESTPKVVQFIDSFSARDSTCIWEGL